MVTPAPGPTPTWPQLGAWSANPTMRTAAGTWRQQEGDRRLDGTFAWRAPHEWVETVDGELSHEAGSLVRPQTWRRGDFSRSTGPVREVEVAGRRCWEADLVAPPGGLLSVAVDDETGAVLRLRNGVHLLEVVTLVIDEDLPDAVFAPLREAERRYRDAQRLDDLVRLGRSPAPRWFPYAGAVREGAFQMDGGSVRRLRPGQPEPRARDPYVVRLSHAGADWLVGSERPMSEADARRVVESCA